MSINFKDYELEKDWESELSRSALLQCSGILPWITEPDAKANENKCTACNKVLEAGESHYNTGALFCMSVRYH